MINWLFLALKPNLIHFKDSSYVGQVCEIWLLISDKIRFTDSVITERFGLYWADRSLL